MITINWQKYLFNRSIGGSAYGYFGSVSIKLTVKCLPLSEENRIITSIFDSYRSPLFRYIINEPILFLFYIIPNIQRFIETTVLDSYRILIESLE